eukprot:scaffold6832_cov81-Skeletonema_menzelii.AAC.39
MGLLSLSHIVVISTLLLLTLYRIDCFSSSSCISWPQHRSRSNLLLDSSSASSAIDGDKKPAPPVPFRDENAFVWAGELPGEALQDNSSPPPIRQSKLSRNPLLSPPRRLPNPYGWMRDDSRTNATVLNHLLEENLYTRLMTQHLDGLTEQLYQEFLSAIEETDYTSPAACGAYWYYSRFIEGLSYPIYCRAPRKKGELYHPPINERWNEKCKNPFDMQPLLSDEEVYLHLPKMAAKKKYLAAGAIKVSPDDTHVAYSLDEVGGETCQLYIKHIESNKERLLYDGDKPLEGDGSLCWDLEGKSIFFCTMDATHRPYRLYRRQIFDDEGNYNTLIIECGTGAEYENSIFWVTHQRGLSPLSSQPLSSSPPTNHHHHHKPQLAAHYLSVSYTFLPLLSHTITVSLFVSGSGRWYCYQRPEAVMSLSRHLSYC